MRADLRFSFFMFTADLRPGDEVYAQTIVAHMRELLAMGYAGFDLPIAPGGPNHAAELAHYEQLRRALDAAQLGPLRLTTNVATWPAYDAASPDAAVREAALAYLKSRVDITKALGATIMAGPIVLPYGSFPKRDGTPLWSDALQDWARERYRAAEPVLAKLAAYAEHQGIKVAIEPVDHWETAGPNLVGEVLEILEAVPSRQIGVCIDSAHVALGSDDPARFAAQAARAKADGRLHYVHLSAPDRGALADSWIDWPRFLAPIRGGDDQASYDGPYLVEVFNAIPAFLDGLRLTRRKFWIPGEDAPEPGRHSAYDIARDALATARAELARPLR